MRTLDQLKKQVISEREMKHQARKELSTALQLKATRVKVVNVVFKLINDSLLTLTDEQIGEYCFITKKSVIQARSRLNDKNNTKTVSS